MTSKKTLVIGASSNPEQYSNIAITRLLKAGHEVVAIGRGPFNIDSVEVVTEKLPFKEIHTVTLYLNESRQKEYQDYILALHPTRIIFNPGAENESLKQLAEKEGIEAIDACTLVMLSIGAY